MKRTAARTAAVSSDLSQTDLPQADLSQDNVIRWCVLFINDPSASCRWSCGKVGCGNGLKVWDKNKIMASEFACGLKNALDYLVSEKLLNFAEAAEQDLEFAAELPRFQAAVWEVFHPYELAGYLASLRPMTRKKLQKLLYVRGSGR